jgi:hypothetical protein
VFHDLHPAGLKLVDDRQGVGLGPGQGKQVADQVRVKSPDATPEPANLGQRSDRIRQADGGEQLIESGPGQKICGHGIEEAKSDPDCAPGTYLP